MFSPSTRMIILLATICFLGSVLIQTWWVRSAWEGEMSTFNKAKSRFQTDIEKGISSDSFFVSVVRNLLSEYEKKGQPGIVELYHFTHIMNAYISNAQKQEGSIWVDDFGIVKHAHDKLGKRQLTPLPLWFQKTDPSVLEKAGSICLDCVLKKNSEKEHGFQLLLVYRDPNSAIFKKLALLIAGSLLFLIGLAILFRMVLKKQQQEQRLSVAKNDFINNLSHEIQTPVFAIQMANKLIKETSNDVETISPYTGVIEKETGQLKSHAGKILELASLENNQVSLDLQPVDINELIVSKKNTMDLLVKNAGGTLRVLTGKGSAVVNVDEVHFNNLLLSLIDNAVKYTDGKPEIDLRTASEKKGVRIEVTDKGIGIRKEHLPYVFDKFYRVREGKEKKGFGLGLSYVKQIVDLHGGNIVIKSTHSQGTHVTISLPKLDRNA
jgi:signal transduction histidine kinase